MCHRAKIHQSARHLQLDHLLVHMDTEADISSNHISQFKQEASQRQHFKGRRVSLQLWPPRPPPTHPCSYPLSRSFQVFRDAFPPLRIIIILPLLLLHLPPDSEGYVHRVRCSTRAGPSAARRRKRRKNERGKGKEKEKGKRKRTKLRHMKRPLRTLQERVAGERSTNLSLYRPPHPRLSLRLPLRRPS